jgi:hypothetical protein
MKAPALDAPSAVRCVNVVNFIRGVEPRFETDLLLPVQKQMEIILRYGLPATWLLQFDALVDDRFVRYLKSNMAADHEVGTWFEMNEKHCKAAGVPWRGRPGYEWDYAPDVAFSIGYSPSERVRLADTAMRQFREVWGKYPKSVASWNLDSITIAHLADRFGVDAFAVCRDQLATDGFTIWGAPIAGYFPSKANCWSPALEPADQIHAPVLRMLGQDPVYYYNRSWTMPDGKRLEEPDTMEPVWTSGQSPEFVQTFLDMIAEAPTEQFAYVQLGQENSFPWDQQAPGYEPQMKALAELRKSGAVHVETMGASGRRFQKAFALTPNQAQVQLQDPFGNTSSPQRSVWHQSRFYRANLHLQGDLPFLRDIAVYSSLFPQPFLKEATREKSVEQRMPALLDGYDWRTDETPGAGGFFVSGGQRLTVSGTPTVTQASDGLAVNHGPLKALFSEKRMRFSLANAWSLEFVWDPAKTALADVSPNKATFRWKDFEYAAAVVKGRASRTDSGWKIDAEDGTVEILAAQPV